MKIQVCIINHKSRYENGLLVDYNKAFPDPYKDGKYGSTGICRNTKNTSPQHEAFSKFHKKHKVYFLYCSNIGNEKYFTGLLEVTGVYENHTEHAWKSKKIRPNNLIQQNNNQELTRYRRSELKWYFPRSEHPYIEWLWDDSIPSEGISMWSISDAKEYIRKVTGFTDLRSWTWKWWWTEFNSLDQMYSWIEKVTFNNS